MRVGLGFAMILAGTLAGTAAAQPSPDNPLRGLAADPGQQYALFYKQTYFAARRGSVWLVGMQRPDGMYMPGWIPGVNRPAIGDNLVDHAAAAVALARTTALAHDPELERAARRTIAVLLSMHTAPDPANPEIRRPSASPIQANPVALAAYLIIAIHELPNPGNDLLERAEELCRFLASRRRADGSLNVSPSLDADSGDPPALIVEAAGPALFALIRSESLSPADYKKDLVKTALPYYRNHFRQQPSLDFVPWQAMAHTEMFMATNEVPHAEFVLEMTDWITQFQYTGANAEQQGWRGGFASFGQGAVVMTPPGISTAAMLEALVAGFRIAELVDDASRREGFRTAAELAARFLQDCQFTTTTADHYQPALRHRLIGAFHQSVERSEVRILSNAQAVSSLVHFLNFVAAYQPPAATTAAKEPEANRQ